ncbi:MAG TPA: DUF1697 domain-containing protein [Solirubrobacterales bacterium]|nr:DUF1697 domain-containing protein [Solirubrobacterales bacterium]
MAKGLQYLALLRGINVGGNNKVAMADLRESFEAMGFEEVGTYINSGNVFFRAPRQERAELAAGIEAGLSERFGFELKVVVVTEAELRAVIADAPRGFGAATELCDVIFIRKPLTVKKAVAAAELKEGVDRIWAGKGVVYFSRLKEKASSSRLSKLAVRSEYKNVTVRSWSSANKLLTQLDKRGG